MQCCEIAYVAICVKRHRLQNLNFNKPSQFSSQFSFHYICSTASMQIFIITYYILIF